LVQLLNFVDVFRITKSKWANSLVASGYAARWNDNGQYIIYAAQSRSLACLENLVHRNGVGVDSDFSTIIINIPDRLERYEIFIKDLPLGWNEPTESGFLICRKFTQNWLRLQTSAVLFVPSAIIPEEKNILINPNHKDFDKITIKSVESFIFDKRF
jgi:RES domain-containing protein